MVVFAVVYMRVHYQTAKVAPGLKSIAINQPRIALLRWIVVCMCIVIFGDRALVQIHREISGRVLAKNFKSLNPIDVAEIL